MKSDLTFSQEFQEKGFTLAPFPQELREEMLFEIESRIREVGALFGDQKATDLEKIAMSVPDEVWGEQMTRAFRIFSADLAKKAHGWADGYIRQRMGRLSSAINVVYPAEVQTNKKLNPYSLAVYWRCVRSGKPDAGRPHRDSSFWVLEFEEGYDPKIPFQFNYLKDCIKIWVPLKGCTPLTTLQVVPYSHKMEVPTTVESTEYGRRPSISKMWLDQNEKNFISPVELSKGSCIVFDMDLVHRGPTHNNNELRISAELCFVLR